MPGKRHRRGAAGSLRDAWSVPARNEPWRWHLVQLGAIPPCRSRIQAINAGRGEHAAPTGKGACGADRLPQSLSQDGSAESLRRAQGPVSCGQCGDGGGARDAGRRRAIHRQSWTLHDSLLRGARSAIGRRREREMPLLLQRAIRFAGGLPLLSPPDVADEIVRALVDTGDWLQATTAWPMPTANPYGIEGYKTIAYEIYRDLGDRWPDRLLIPTAGGDLLTGIWLGQRDLIQAGWILNRGSPRCLSTCGSSSTRRSVEQGLDTCRISKTPTRSRCRSGIPFPVVMRSMPSGLPAVGRRRHG